MQTHRNTPTGQHHRKSTDADLRPAGNRRSCTAGAWAFGAARRHVAVAVATMLAVLGAAAQEARPWPPSRNELDAIGRAIVSEGCARPREMKSSFVRSARGDSSDEMRSIDCRGVRIATYLARGPDGARETPMELVIESPHPHLDARLGVGAEAAAVRAALGPPNTTRGENFSYVLRGRDTLGFEVRGGVVRTVTWSWDVE